MIELLKPGLSGGFLGTSICHSPATHQSSIGQNGRRDYVFSLAPPPKKTMGTYFFTRVVGLTFFFFLYVFIRILYVFFLWDIKPHPPIFDC